VRLKGDNKKLKSIYGREGIAIEVYDFGLRLQQLRAKKKLTQDAAASRLGLTKGTVSSYERNVKTPKIDVLVKLAILYDTSADYILGLTDRTSVFLDDLSEKDQKIVLSMLVALKEELQNNKTDD